MLIEFRVENHRSIRDEQVLSMEASVDKGDKEDLRPRSVKGYKKKLLPVACIYGANASGKSNVLSAMWWMWEAVISSSRNWDPLGGIPRDAFAWASKHTEPSTYEITMIIDNVRYQYGFTTSDVTFVEEWLYTWPFGKKQMWFERDNQIFRFGSQLNSSIRIASEATRHNALLLSTAFQLANSAIRPIVLWFYSFASFQAIYARRTQLDMSIELKLSVFMIHKFEASLVPQLMPFLQILKAADIGIDDFRIYNNDVESISNSNGPRFLLKHSNSAKQDVWRRLEDESKGTQTLFRMGLPICIALKNGSVLLIDELESSLHPALARYIVELFNNPKTNPKNAQLIFTTHDTNLLGTTLGEPELRRDEVWLTEKDKDGATVLYPLTDYKPRAEENLERGYLQGRYGAIPFLGNFSLAGK